MLMMKTLVAGFVSLIAVNGLIAADDANRDAQNPQSASELYRDSEKTEPTLTDTDRRIMPYVLGLHVDGKTRDGKHVRLNVPIHVKVDPALQTRKGLFPVETDHAGRVKLDKMYAQLEEIFSREFGRVSEQFTSTDYYQSAPGPTRRCNVGSDQLCAALEQVWPSAVRVAMSDGSITIAVVDKWVNHFGTYDTSPRAGGR